MGSEQQSQTERAYDNLQEISDKYVQWSNQEYNELTKQVTVFVSILMPLTVLLLTSDNLKANDVFTARVAFAMMVSFSTTLLIGSASYIINGEFWKRGSEKISDAMDELVKIRPDESVNEDEEDDFISTLYKKTFDQDDSGYDWLFNIAIFSFVTGIGCFLIVMYRTLL